MIRLTIGGAQCDFDASQKICLKFESESLADVESGRKGSSLCFRLPTSEANARALGLEWDLHPLAKFNSEWHSMVVEVDGIELFSGTAYLLRVVDHKGVRYAEVECRGGVLEWAAKAAATKLSKLNIDYSKRLNMSTIKESWSDDDGLVKFFPVVRDSYQPRGSAVNVTGLRVARSTDDYHPFFNVAKLLEEIFSTSGYTFSSETLEQEHFDELYISGNYSSQDSTAAHEAMGFYIKRGSDTSTVTDSMGRIQMSPYDAFSTVGNIVDIATLDSDNECYNHGNVMQMANDAVVFVPPTQVSAGFEYFLHYTCECEIESREKLKGIDSLNTISNGRIEWELTNRYLDQRDDLVVGLSYKLMIFDFEPGERYRFMGVSSVGIISQIKILTTRMTTILFSALYSQYRLEKYSDGAYVSCDDDWAIYFGYVEESAPLEVEVTVRSAPQSYSPLSPMEFEFQMLEGAVAGAEFTLHGDTSVRPYFSYYPGYNSLVSFEQLAQHNVTALGLLSSLQHLFNLRFMTDVASRRVVVESFDSFYTAATHEWSDRVVVGEPIEWSDWAHSTHRSIKLGYQQTDGVVRRKGESDNKYFGEYIFAVDSYAAAPTQLVLLNPLLSASTCDEQGVMVVGDRDDVEQVDSLNFSARIGRYFDIRRVVDENYSLPYIAFHDPDEEFSLCFEDRDGIEGLNRFYGRETWLRARAQLIELSVRLSALEYSNLFDAERHGPSCRDRFCFTLFGESFTTILYSIESYDLRQGVARCLFLTID